MERPLLSADEARLKPVGIGDSLGLKREWAKPRPALSLNPLKPALIADSLRLKRGLAGYTAIIYSRS